MESILHDKSIVPNEDVIFSVIGDAELLWKRTFTYLSDNCKDSTVNWKYSDCGRYWVCIVLKKKNPLFRLRVLKSNSFHVAFPFSDKVEPVILQSELPDRIKNDFVMAKRYNATRYISIEVEDAKDFENVKKLIDIKINN